MPNKRLRSKARSVPAVSETGGKRGPTGPTSSDGVCNAEDPEPVEGPATLPDSLSDGAKQEPSPPAGDSNGDYLDPREPAVGLLSAEAWRKTGRVLGLTGRQTEIARLICEGKSRSAVARLLKASEGTVQTHLKRIHRKLRVGDRVNLLARFLRVHEMLLAEAKGRTPR